MEKAARLLEGTALRVSEVGAAVGFTDSNQFSAAFHRAMGTGPRAYRRAGRGSTGTGTESAWFRDDFGDIEDRFCYQVYKRRSEKCEVCPVE